MTVINLSRFDKQATGQRISRASRTHPGFLPDLLSIPGCHDLPALTNYLLHLQHFIRHPLLHSPFSMLRTYGTETETAKKQRSIRPTTKPVLHLQ